MVIIFKKASRGIIAYIIRGGGHRSYHNIYMNTYYQNEMHSDLHIGNYERGFRVLKLIKYDCKN